MALVTGPLDPGMRYPTTRCAGLTDRSYDRSDKGVVSQSVIETVWRLGTIDGCYVFGDDGGSTLQGFEPLKAMA